MVCSRCKKRPATVFITRMEGEKTVNDGLCLICAKELGIKPVCDIIDRFGMSEEDLESVDEQLTDMLAAVEDGEGGAAGFDPGGAATFPFLQNIFPGMNNRAENGADKPKKEKNEDGKEGKRSRRASALEQYCTNLTARARDGEIGRVIGLPYPGGAALDKLAYEGDPKSYTLPSPALTGDTLDFSFSGLKTAALNLITQAKQKEEEIDRANLAASYTRAIVCGVSKKVGQALKQTGHKTVVLAGGVAANSHLRRELEATCKRYGARLVTPPISLCGDNGAMVAAAGYFEYLEGRFADTSLNASANDDGN